MSEMNTNYTFANEKFTINPDVYFTVDTTVVNGHRICKLKTLKIYYHGELFEMKLGKTSYRYVIEHGLQSIFSVELVNYLNRFIFHENLYEVYSSESKLDNLGLKSSVVWSHDRNNQQEISSFIIHDKSNEINSKRYKEGLIQNSLFVKSELDKLRNPNYPICYSKYEEIKNIPIFCYVHPSLRINQGSTIILCHIGYILEKLANYKRFPEFNTQAVISFMNVVNEASRNNLTAEHLNEIDFKIEIEKLQKKYLKKKEKCKSLEKQMEDLFTKIDNQTEEISNLNKKIDKQSKKIGNQTEEICNLNKKIDNQSKKIGNQTEEISNLNKKIDKQSGTICSLESKVIGGLRVIQQMKNSQDLTYKIVQETNQKQIQFLKNEVPPSAIGMKQTDEITLFIYSPRLQQEVINSLPDLKLNDGDLILDTISCQTKDLKSHLIKHKYYELAKGLKSEDEVITYRLTCNSLDLNKFAQRFSVSSNLLDGKGKFIRKFIVNKSNLEVFKTEFNEFVDSLEENHRKTIELLKDSSSIVSNYKDDANELIDNYIQDDFYDKNEIKNTTIKAQIDYLTLTVQEIKNNQEIQSNQISEIKNNQEVQSNQISEIKNNQLVMMNLLTSLNPKIKHFQIKLDHYYYDIIEENNQVMYATKRSKDGLFSEFQPLTIELFNKSIFRDKDNIKDIYLPSKRKIIE